ERRDGQIAAVTSTDANAAFTRIGAPTQPLAASFGEIISLGGFELNSTQLRHGDRLWVSLLWRAKQPQLRTYLVFLQVLDAADRKVAQWDGAAGGDWWPTPAWRPGQSVWQDVPLRLDPYAPPGRYRLIAGLYDPATGTRLRLSDGADALVLGQVDVLP